MKTCSIDGCERPAKSLGMCQGHYMRHWTGMPVEGLLRSRRPDGSPAKKCSVEGCDRPAKAKGFCGTHHERWRLHGDPLVTLKVGRKPSTH